MKTIGLSDQVKERLIEIKERDGHTSFDSVLRYLLRRAGENEVHE